MTQQCFRRPIAVLAALSLTLTCASSNTAMSESKQCKVVSQDEVVSKGELLKEALGAIGSGTLLLLSIRTGAPRIALAAEGAVVLKEMAGLAPHLSHAVQLKRLRSYFGLADEDKLEICFPGNSLAAELGFRDLAMIGPANKSIELGEKLSPFTRQSPFWTTTLDPFKRDIADALKGLNNNDVPLGIAPKPFQFRDRLGLPKLSQPSALSTFEQHGLFTTYSKSPGLLTLEATLASLTGTLRGIVLDPEGKSVPAASVQLTDDKTKIKTLIKTDQEGKYVADKLLVGDYAVTASAANFAEQQKFTRVLVGSNADVNFVLPRGTVRDCDYKVSNATPWPVLVGQVNGTFSVRLAANEATVFSKLAPATALRGTTELPNPAYAWSITVSCDAPSSRLGPP